MKEIGKEEKKERGTVRRCGENEGNEKKRGRGES